MVATKYPSSRRVLLIDANGRVAPSRPHAGQPDADTTNSDGAALVAVLRACRLRADSTFFPAGCAWRHVSGSTARIDYVCSDLGAAGERSHAEFPTCVDLSLSAGEDRRCAAAWYESEARTTEAM